MKVKPKNFDFAGWVSKKDVRCTDGTVIREGAFAHLDGKKVPLIWNHQHNSPDMIIGHTILENRSGGTYGYGFLNGTANADTVREIIAHGDVMAMSIYANHAKITNRGDVLHGDIQEVSLVLAGADKEAVIEHVIEHADDEESTAFYFSNDPDQSELIFHSDAKKKKKFDDDEDEDEESEEPEDDEEEEDDQDDEETDNESDEEEDEDMVDEKKRKIRHADDENEGGGKTVKDVFDTLNEEQKTAVYAIIGAALEDKKGGGNSDEEDDEVKHNVFDSDYDDETLVHADFGQIMDDYKRFGSMKAAVENQADALGVSTAQLIHADTYGIHEIETLFPDAKYLSDGTPEFIKRDTDWVQKVLGGTHHSPFSRVKSRFANITEDEARARGYLKGRLKKEEVFSLLKRATDPQTIYKKQKLDRDDIIDITDFDVVAWIRQEMKMMLDEEIARAILIGDGRLNSDEDKISEDHIRSIWREHDLFAVHVTITMPEGSTDDDRSKAFIRACIKSRKYYKGSGTPTMFTTEDLISDALLLEDGIGHMLYESEAALATKCRVSSMVTVPVMEGATDETMGDLAAIIVNLKDYNVGSDKGGNVTMFDDFDIDYNQQKYLIETRISGALIKPYSAIVISFKTSKSVTAPTITFSGNGLDEYAVKKGDKV